MFESDTQLQPIIDTVQELMDQKDGPILIGIDGRTGSGKSTLAKILSQKLGCDIVQADDFFLRKEQRTYARLKEPGGNIDRERMMKEIFGPISHQSEIDYRVFDCETLSLGRVKHVKVDPVLIIEGSYCLHPAFQDFYDLKIFVDIESFPQLARIVKRNGTDMADVYQMHWIPMEEKYFSHFGIRACADLIV